MTAGAAASPSSPAPLRIGILGVARVCGEALVLPAQALGHRLVSVSSRDRRRAEFFARLCGVERVAASHADVLSDPEVEAVYIPQVPSRHTGLVLAAIAAGKHVLCEKPLCLDAAGAVRIRAAAEAAPAPASPRAGRNAAGGRLVVAEALHYLAHPLWGRLGAWLAASTTRPDVGTLGSISAVEVDVAMRPPPAGDPRWSADLGGGALNDLGCYGLQIQRLVACAAGCSRGPGAACTPDVASADARARGEVDETVRIRLRHPSGATGVVRASMAARSTRHRLIVTGSRARLVVDGFLLPHLGGSVTLEPAGPAPAEQAEPAESAGSAERAGPAWPGVPAPGALFPRALSPGTLFRAPSTYTHQLDGFAGRVRSAGAAVGPVPGPLGWSLDDSVAVARLMDDSRRAAGLPPAPTAGPRAPCL